MPHLHAHIEELEQQLSLFVRRSRSNSARVASQVHPRLDSSSYLILLVLQREGNLRLTELASNIGVGKPALSRKVAEMVKLGVINREEHPTDRRANFLSLSEQGAASLKKAQDARSALFRTIMEDWSAEDLIHLALLIAKLNATFAEKDQWSQTPV